MPATHRIATPEGGIHESHPALRVEQHVLRLHRTMHDAAAMQILEGADELRGDATRVARIESALILELSAKRVGAVVLHRKPEQGIGDAESQDGNEMRVIELRVRFHRVAESQFGVGIIGASLTGFEDDFAPTALFNGAEDDGALTSTDDFHDLEFVRELPSDEICEHVLPLDSHGGVEPVTADFADAGIGGECRDGAARAGHARGFGEVHSWGVAVNIEGFGVYSALGAL